MTLLGTCLCGSNHGHADVIHGVPVLICGSCGIIRQDVQMSPPELADWYRQRYFTRPVPHTYPTIVSHEQAYQHDCRVAEMRLAAYQIPAGAVVLDVGAGNGAFVASAREAGLEAWGTDLTPQSETEHIYIGALEEIAFPTASFDVVTLHDVLEHLIDPWVLLQEIRRILKPTGRLIVDFPRFFHENGAHHWRLVEHLWCLNEAQLAWYLERAGFVVGEPAFPIPTKVVYDCQVVRVPRVRIAVPPGIGDTYWSLVKLPGFLATHRLGLPDVWVQHSHLNRTLPFLRLVPFVHAMGYAPVNGAVFHEAYMQDGRRVFPDPSKEMDWFIAYNGVMRHGKRLEDVDPQYGVAWRPRLHFSKEALAAEAAQRALGPYVVCFVATNSMYNAWWKYFTPEMLEAVLVTLHPTRRVVMVGAHWDLTGLGATVAAKHPEWTNLIGETTVDQLLGVLRGACAVFGYPAGNTLIAPALNTPTVLMWSDYFPHRAFWHGSVAPGSPYRALDVRGSTIPGVLAAIHDVQEEAHVHASTHP